MPENSREFLTFDINRDYDDDTAVSRRRRRRRLTCINRLSFVITTFIEKVLRR